MHVSSVLFGLSVATNTFALNVFPRQEYLESDCTIKFPNSKEPGKCRKTSDCTSQGYNEAGFCDGPTNVQCCAVKQCQKGGATGICQNTGDGACSGHFEPGVCPGPSTVQCCLPGAGSGDGGGSGGGDDNPAPSGGSSSAADKIVSAAESQKGVDYVWGGGGCEGKSNGGFDCSGLTQYSVCQAGLGTIPRTAKSQYEDKKGRHIPRADAQKGDLIFWAHGGNCPGSVSHVGIYVRPGIMVNAARSGTPVREQTIWTSSEGTSICPDAVRYW